MKKRNFIIVFVIFIFFFSILFSKKVDAISINTNGNILDFPDVPDEAIFYTIFNARGKIRLCYTTNVNCVKIHLRKSLTGNLSVVFLDDFGNCLQEKRFYLENNEWVFSSAGTDGVIGGCRYVEPDVYFSNVEIYNIDNQLYYAPKYSFDINYFEDNSYCQITSGYFDIVDFDNINCEISSDNVNFKTLTKEGAEPDSNGSGQFINFVFWTNIYKNGTYYIRYTKSDGTVLCKFKLLINEIDENSHSLNLHLSTTENTTEPVFVLSNRYYYEGDYNAEEDWLLNYDIDIAYGLETPYDFSPFEVDGYDEEKQMNYREYQYKIVINGIYKFRILDLTSGEITYQTFNISNIGFKNKYGDDVFYNNYNGKGEFDATPCLFLEYVDTTTVRIRTQPFIFNELMYLECYFSSDNEKYERNNNIYKSSIDTENSNYNYITGEKQNILDVYHFYYDVKTDGTYYFKFYNINLKKYTVASIDVNIQEFLVNNIDNVEKYPDKFILWGDKHFGILIYPFRFIINFLDRVDNISYGEPIVHIPELHDPFWNHKICNSVDFNFNSILSNNVIKTIHNIYLIAVDFIFIMLFVGLCKNTFKEVFNK